MKTEKKIITLVIIAIVLVGVLSFSLSSLFADGQKLAGNVSNTSSVKKSSVYKDWSELDSIDNDYSYSTIFYTNETDFYVNATSTEQISTFDTTYFEGRSSLPALTFFDKDQKGQIIITNCGVDKDGNKLSAVLDISIRDVWPLVNTNDQTEVTESDDRVLAKVYPQGYVYTLSQNKPNLTQGTDKLARRVRVDYNVPIAFVLNANRSTVNIELTYYKADSLEFTSEPSGINAVVDKNNSVVATNITKVNSYYSDLDTQPGTMVNYTTAQAVVDNAKSTGRDISFDGNEGVRPTNGASTIYYNKNIASIGPSNYTNELLSDLTESEKPSITLRLGEASDGIYIDECNINKSYGYYKNVMNLSDEEIYKRYIFDDTSSGSTERKRKFTMNGGWYPNSAEFLTSGLEGKYSFAYEGYSCGIQFMFFSPQAYEIPDPVKTVSKEAIQPNETAYFNVRQYIPNNYLTNLIDFSTVYTDTYQNGNLIQSFTITDAIDSRFKVLNSGDTKITLTDSNGNDLSEHFNISVDDNNKVVVLSDDEDNEYFNSASAYDLFFNLSIPFVYEGSAVPGFEVPNTVITKLKVGTRDEVEKESNEVTVAVGDKTVKLTYDCTTNGGKALFEPISIDKIPRTEVELDRVCVREGYRFVGWVTEPKDSTPLTSYTMPDQDTTLYGIYVPSTCDTILYSDTYKIDQTNRNINIPNDDSDSTILKRVTSKGEISISGTTITVKCDGSSREYTINRYWVSKTGNEVIKWTAIIAGTLLLAVIAFFIKIKTSKNEK